MMKDPTLRNRINKTDKYSKITLPIQRPPINTKQFLNDEEFSMLIDQIYNLDHTEVGWKSYNKCPTHIEKECDLAHMMNCQRSELQTVRCHNAICYYIYKKIKRNKNFVKPKMESYSEFQERQRKNGSKGKRADITYYLNNDQHTLDIAVVSTDLNKESEPIGRQYTTKMRVYKDEPNIHPIVFGTNGDVHEKSWKFLTEIGFSIADLREIQQLIIKHSTMKIHNTQTLNTKTWQQRDRNMRRRNNKNKRNSKKNNDQKNNKNNNNSILNYISE